MEMIVDSPAVVAIILGETGYERYEEAIAAAAQPRISAVSLYEAGVALLVRKGPSAVALMLKYLEEAAVAVAAFEAADATAATEAYERFGKGRNPIGLNPGDCAVYALARRHNEPVLSTSDEFTRSGLRSALPGVS